MTANVEKLQETLDRLTTKLDRWKQSRWCDVKGGIDPITDADLESLTYHDFELTPEFAEWYRDLPEYEREDVPVPVADCGTRYCVAGDVCVSNGYTFMGEVGEDSASRVVLKDHIAEFLQSGHDVSWLPGADDVARDILNISYGDSRVMFALHRSLPEIWGIAYAVTHGRITLPETLPETERRDPYSDRNVITVPGTDSAIDTRRVIMEALYDVGDNIGKDEWTDVARRELDKMDATT